MDFIRTPYTTRFLPFRDSDVEADLVWYPAREDAPVLPYDSAIYSLIWDDDRYAHEGVGEVPSQSIRPNWEKTNPLALGVPCGNPTDFAQGGLYLPDDPPVERFPSGLLACCGPFRLGDGGFEIGGSSDIIATPVIVSDGGYEMGGSSLVTWYVELVTDGGFEIGGSSDVTWSGSLPTDGGFEIGGSSDVWWSGGVVGDGGWEIGGSSDIIATPVIVSDGGYEMGGAADWVYTPMIPTDGGWEIGGSSAMSWYVEIVTDGGWEIGGSSDVTYTAPGPGPTCATAGTLVSGVPYVGSLAVGESVWFTFAVAVGGGSFAVTITLGGVTNPTTFVYKGSCASLSVLGILGGNSSGAYATAGAPFDAYANVVAGAATAYSIQFDQM